MSTEGVVCGGCLRVIEDKRMFLKCRGCDLNYDLECANVSEKRFLNTLRNEHRDAWRCVSCKSKQPKSDNTNTPVRSALEGVTVSRGAAVRSPTDFDMSIVEQPMSIPDPCDLSLNATQELTDMQSLVLEMRAFKCEIRDELKSNRTQLERVNETLTVISGRIAKCEDRIDKLENRITKLEQDVQNGPVNQSLAATVDQLKAELNDRDQELLLNDVEISGIPEKGGESLFHIATAVGSKLGTNLTEQDIVSVVRVGRVLDVTTASSTTPRPRPIVVRLARRSIRDQLLQAARVRRGATTEEMDFPCTPRRFYVNERLTKANRQLFHRARELGHRLGWRFIWTRDGRIFARQDQNKDSPRHRLRLETDLRRVFGVDTVGPAVGVPVLA